MKRAEYHGESELRWKSIEFDDETEAWLEYHKHIIELYEKINGVPAQIVTVNCYECNFTYETIFSPKVTCPICETTNDCIIDGKPTAEWKLRHS